MVIQCSTYVRLLTPSIISSEPPLGLPSQFPVGSPVGLKVFSPTPDGVLVFIPARGKMEGWCAGEER